GGRAQLLERGRQAGGIQRIGATEVDPDADLTGLGLDGGLARRAGPTATFPTGGRQGQGEASLNGERPALPHAPGDVLEHLGILLGDVGVGVALTHQRPEDLLRGRSGTGQHRLEALVVEAIRGTHVDLQLGLALTGLRRTLGPGTAPLGALTTGTALLHLEEHGAMALAGPRLKGLGGALRAHQAAEGGAQIVAEDLPLGRAEVLERRLEGLRVQPGLGAEVDPQLGLTLAGLERGRASALATAVTLTATLALATVTALALLAALLAITPLALLATLTLLAARGAGLTCRCGALGALLTSGFGSTGAIHPQPGEEELEQEGDEIIGVLAALELIGQGQVALVDRAARLLADLPDVPV